MPQANKKNLPHTFKNKMLEPNLIPVTMEKDGLDRCTFIAPDHD
jgi:hypothetical protein